MEASSVQTTVCHIVSGNISSKIIAIFNLSNKTQTAEIQSALAKGKLRDIISGEKAPRGTNLKFELKAWEYKVFAQ